MVYCNFSSKLWMPIVSHPERSASTFYDLRSLLWLWLYRSRYICQLFKTVAPSPFVIQIALPPSLHLLSTLLSVQSS